MSNHPIIDEVRRARKDILDSYGGDVQAMMRDSMKRQFERGREVVSFVPKTTHYIGPDGELRPFFHPEKADESE
ncbi:MAG: hypothetical protein JNK74_01905 [Candidatus Hydrogenedentes bacterium]|nr:hypothetical protein [Candidatus Hydrogenedentota bacterium]